MPRHSHKSVTTGLDPVVHADATRPNAGGSAVPAKLSHGLPGLRPAMTKEITKEKKIRRRNADRRNSHSAVASATAAPGSPGAHLSAFHRGSRPEESFIARDAAPGFFFLGPGGKVGGLPSSGRYPPYLSQSSEAIAAWSQWQADNTRCRPGAGCKSATLHINSLDTSRN